MADYYEQLGLTQDATEEEIKKAYRRLVLVTHPDRVPGKEEEFRRIQEAYDTLSDPEQRRNYDAGLNSLDNCLGHIERLARQGLRFHLVESPELYDHYAYINALFNWSGKEALVGGQDISEQHDTFWEMLNYVDYRLCRIEERLKVMYRRNPSEEVKARLRFIDLHLTKICTVVPVILGCDKRKRLYDLAMGFDQSAEMLEIECLIGGNEVLIQYIEKQATINIAKGFLP
ncbi:J domain-containing protein [Legionella maioricensis]|uniref:DnaJ domain-containing protein n=1 Tax=Legionella maioricensis TaxID=2896528 RepID=A0A9X2D300_9GAMM|nr:J domain-containing protein [Legionella maioricensis]MCL9685526.1 DnaJ domain-containing protein [Legionella maioricensis]MCL9688860.1 DnaJ domain-containing protein [Legionella maioricensis]